MSAVLKLSYEGEVRRVLLEQSQELNYDLVCDKISKAWPEVKDYTAKYIDEEGDLCVLCPASFRDFLSVSKHASAAVKSSGQLVLRLEIVAAKQCLDLDSRAGKALEQDSSATPSTGQSTNDGQDLKQCSGWEWQEPQNWHHNWQHWFTHVERMSHQHADTGRGWSHHGCGWPHVPGWLQSMHQNGRLHHDHQGLQGMFQMHGAHKGKGKCQKHIDGQQWLLKPKKMLWLMAQLYSSEALTAESAVSLWVYLLPKAVELMASDQVEAGRKLRKKLPDIKSMFHNLKTAANQIKGLDHCGAIITQLLASDSRDGDPDADAAAGELLMAMLTAVDSLSFEKQVQFFSAFYELQKESLEELLNSWKSWCWSLPMDHHGVSCDACGSQPLPGLRFKCKWCEDYDLCSSCFVKKQSLSDGKCADHEFTLVPVDWANMWWKKKEHGMHQGWAACKHAWKMWMKGGCEEGTSKGKGKGKFKGKCKGKRAAWEADVANTGVDGEPDNKCPRMSNDFGKNLKCARPECNFKCTWHPTHCCHACAHFGSHGGKCERQQFAGPGVGAEDLEPSAPPQEPGAMSASLEESAKKLEDMGFGSSSDMQSVLKTCGGDLSKALELLTI